MQVQPPLQGRSTWQQCAIAQMLSGWGRGSKDMLLSAAGDAVSPLQHHPGAAVPRPTSCCYTSVGSGSDAAAQAQLLALQHDHLARLLQLGVQAVLRGRRGWWQRGQGEKGADTVLRGMRA